MALVGLARQEGLADAWALEWILDNKYEVKALLGSELGLRWGVWGRLCMALVYVIEDDSAIRGELEELLRREGYEVECATEFGDGTAAGALAASPDIVLLDLTLPRTDGQFVCRELRQASDVPIVVLTSRTTEVDEVMSMSLGADDFVAKPYSPRVLLARMTALLRRAQGSDEARSTLERGGVTLDLARSRAAHGGREVELTKNEMRILALLIRRGETIVSREALMRELWESDAFVDDNTLTVNVARLRQALEKIGVVDWLVTHRGQGYSVR